MCYGKHERIITSFAVLLFSKFNKMLFGHCDPKIIYILYWKVNNSWCALTDILAKTEALVVWSGLATGVMNIGNRYGYFFQHDAPAHTHITSDFDFSIKLIIL